MTEKFNRYGPFFPPTSYVLFLNGKHASNDNEKLGSPHKKLGSKLITMKGRFRRHLFRWIPRGHGRWGEFTVAWLIVFMTRWLTMICWRRNQKSISYYDGHWVSIVLCCCGEERQGWGRYLTADSSAAGTQRGCCNELQMIAGKMVLWWVWKCTCVNALIGLLVGWWQHLYRVGSTDCLSAYLGLWFSESG